MHVHLLHAEVGLAKLFFLDGLLTNNLATNDMGCTMNTIRKTFATCMALCAFTFLSPLVFADIEQQMGQLNADMALIERDVSALEQNLLFPPVTRTKVFLSLAADADFTLRSVSLRLDNREQSFHVYSQQEVDALRLGGIQSLWEGNVALGKRTLLAKFEGVDRRSESVKGEASLSFEKAIEGRALELQIVGRKQTTYTLKDRGAK